MFPQMITHLNGILADGSTVSRLKRALEASEVRARRAEELLGESEALVTSLMQGMERAAKKQRLVEERLEALQAAADRPAELLPASRGSSRASRVDEATRAERAERLLEEAEVVLTSLMLRAERAERAEHAESLQRAAERRTEVFSKQTITPQAQSPVESCASEVHVEVDHWLADDDWDISQDQLTLKPPDNRADLRASPRIIRVEAPTGESQIGPPTVQLIVLPPACKGASATLLVVPTDKSI